MEYKDYYKILGVSQEASQDEIKKAYRKLARKYHPDVSSDPDAETRIKEINEAYEVLGDAEKREAYDQLGSNWRQGQDFGPPPGGWDGWTQHGGAGRGDDVSEPAAAGPRKEGTMVTVVYVLYLVSFLTAITAIAGLIIAYIKRGEADHVSVSHFTYQTRTFWIGLMFAVIGVITSPIGIGALIFLALVIWWLVRCIKGLLANSDNRAIEQPETWLW